jgi:glutamate carboxypeptidase
MPSIEKNIEIIRQNLTNDLHLYLDVLEKMVNINSFTANITGINQLGDFTASIFKSLGFMSEAIPSNNPKFGNHIFLTREGSSNKSMAMISHLDTVFPLEEEIQNNFAWRVDGNRVYGPGTVDIKGGTVMILIVLETLRRYFPEIFSSITWIIALDATEEVLSNDFGKLLNDRLDSNTIACLVFEGGTPLSKKYPLVTARKGKANFKVLVEGRSAHAGNRHAQGANAIVQMSYTVQQIASLTDYEKLLTFNVGTIHGGSVVNRVPHFAEADVEMRTFSPEYFQEGVNKILALNGSSQVTSQDGFACKVEIKQLDQTDPWPRNTETDRLFEIWKETGQKLNMQIIPEERGGLSDGNLLWKYFPTLDGLGPVGNNAHCSERSPDGSKDQEYVLASSFVPKALLNVLGIVRLSTIQTDTQTGK